MVLINNMRGAPFMATCLRYGLTMNDLVKYGPLINYAELNADQTEKLLKKVRRAKDRANGHGSIWMTLFGLFKA